MIEIDSIHIMDFQHPMKNLSSKDSPRREPEGEFSDLFASAYREKFLQVHRGTDKQKALFVREVPVSSFGIADLLVLSWKSDSKIIDTVDDFVQLKPQTRAFEIKLSDWRSGLMQAHRYKYFANASILVLPFRKMAPAKKQIDLFKAIRVGLWGFEPETETITQLYTPRPKRQMAIAQNKKVITAVAKSVLSQSR